MEKIGTKKYDICYDGKSHELTLTDYLIKLTGNTYHHKAEIYDEGFQWDDMDKAWYKNVESEDEISRLYKKFQGHGICFGLKPIYRITDKS